MNLDRRDFLKKSLLTAGAAAVAGNLASTGSELVQAAEPTAPSNPGPTTPALTTDHKLIHVSAEGKPSHRHHGLLPSNPAVRRGVPGRRWVMVIDLASCDGCKKCTEACQKMHDTPADREWIRVFKMQDSEETAPYYFPRPCFHCDNPPCTKVCPVDATFKRQDGVVLIDNERCIGCRFCMAACPYSVRSFNWGKPKTSLEASAEPYSPETGYPRRVGTVEKCDFCPEMASRGELPGCVSGCPMGAIYFGDECEDAVTNSKGETVRLSQLLHERAAYRYLEELGTKPRVYYLPPKNRLYPEPGAEPEPPHPHEM